MTQNKYPSNYIGKRSIHKVIFGMVVLFFFQSHADVYVFDLAHSYIGFAVKHMVISTTKGKFTSFTGTISTQPDELKSSVEVSIDASSINTENEKRDAHLKGPDFFDTEKFPSITFKSSKLEKKGKDYLLHGTLTMHGVSKKIKIPFELNGPIKNPYGKQVIGIEAEIELNRQDFGISWSKTMDNGGLIVGDKVAIELFIEGIKQ